ncbi:hypothetical protein MSHO_53490 [Mycobacterium shottsii]|uniref:Transposase n=1 Tax=Mycobacterium shottsii TaxID=133549 RepID=A0A7I7LJP5_9MYCO|nr:hypothetical protein MSHO_53490 [Mycobacterium shottsii]
MRTHAISDDLWSLIVAVLPAGRRRGRPWNEDADLGALLSVDSTSVRAHQHAAGARPGRRTGGSVELQEISR